MAKKVDLIPFSTAENINTSKAVRSDMLNEALVAWRPDRFGPVLWAGVVGKLGIMALLLPDVIAGAAPAGTGIILGGDALFTFGFLVFLLRRRAG